MRLSHLEQQIADIVNPVLEEMGMNLLWVKYKGGILTIFAENPKTSKLTLQECANISREVSPLLEVEDPIEKAYRLEISSAGIDRPLFNASDYKKYHDLEAKIELDELIDGQKKFRGYIRETSETEVVLETDQGKVDLPLASIYKAKLVLTDELIKETKKRFETANENAPTEKELTQKN